MITPIKIMTINQIMERSNDLLISVEDIKELVMNERNNTIDDFVNSLLSNEIIDKSIVRRVAEQLKC